MIVEQSSKNNKLNCGQASLFHFPACYSISGNCFVSVSKLTCDRHTAEKILLASSYLRTAWWECLCVRSVVRST